MQPPSSDSDPDSAFSRVPDELWEQIFSQSEISAQRLFKLALSCRRLYRVCLYAYLSHLGTTNPEQIIDIMVAPPGSYDALSAIRLPFFIAKTEDLNVTFSLEKSSTSIILRQVERLQAAISRLDRVKRVALHFVARVIRREYPNDNIDEEEFERWSQTFGLLFNTILEKGCESLDVNGLKGMMGAYHWVPIIPSQSFISSTFSAFRSAILGIDTEDPESILALAEKRWRVERNPSGANHLVTHLSNAARKKTKLRYMTIGSESLIALPLLQWLYSALLASPIESLKLSKFSTKIPWSFVSDLLIKAVPMLKHLELDQLEQGSFQELNIWLESFQHLTMLHISVLHLPWYRGGNPIICPTLPNLVELHVPGNWFEVSFNVERSLLCFPQLQRLTVAFGPRHDVSRGLMKPDTIPRQIFTSLTNRHSVGRLPYSITFKLIFRANFIWYNWMSESVQELMAEWAGCVSNVALVVDSGSPDVDPGKCFEEWLNGFQNLQSLTIKPEPENDWTAKKCCQVLRDSLPARNAID